MAVIRFLTSLDHPNEEFECFSFADPRFVLQSLSASRPHAAARRRPVLRMAIVVEAARKAGTTARLLH